MLIQLSVSDVSTLARIKVNTLAITGPVRRFKEWPWTYIQDHVSCTFTWFLPQSRICLTGPEMISFHLSSSAFVLRSDFISTDFYSHSSTIPDAWWWFPANPFIWISQKAWDPRMHGWHFQAPCIQVDFLVTLQYSPMQDRSSNGATKRCMLPSSINSPRIPGAPVRFWSVNVDFPLPSSGQTWCLGSRLFSECLGSWTCCRTRTRMQTVTAQNHYSDIRSCNARDACTSWREKTLDWGIGQAMPLHSTAIGRFKNLGCPGQKNRLCTVHGVYAEIYWTANLALKVAEI